MLSLQRKICCPVIGLLNYGAAVFVCPNRLVWGQVSSYFARMPSRIISTRYTLRSAPEISINPSAASPRQWRLLSIALSPLSRPAFCTCPLSVPVGFGALVIHLHNATKLARGLSRQIDNDSSQTWFQWSACRSITCLCLPKLQPYLSPGPPRRLQFCSGLTRPPPPRATSTAPPCRPLPYPSGPPSTSTL